MQREQKTAKADCRCEGMLETKSNNGARSIAQLETKEKDGAYSLLEDILDLDTGKLLTVGYSIGH